MPNPHNKVPRAVTSFRLAGTKSFRLSAGQLFGFGMNAQNPPKPLLECLIARPGYSFVQVDQAGAEALVVAHLTRPGAYRQLFQCGVKPHVFVAQHIFGRSKPQWFQGLDTPAEVFLKTTVPNELIGLPGWKQLDKTIKNSDETEPDRPYYSGKRTCHARSYKMGWNTFRLAILKDTQGTMVLDKNTAEQFLLTFDRLFPEIVEWQEEVPKLAHAKGELRNLFGYPRRCDRIFTAGYDRELISWIPQSTVGCITHKAILSANRHIEFHHKKWNIVSNKHDSAMLEVPDEEVNDAARMLTKFMAIDLVGRDGVEFTMKSDVKVGKNWANFNPKTLSNPEGMKEYTIQ